jgi:hypothetical protein
MALRLIFLCFVAAIATNVRAQALLELAPDTLDFGVVSARRHLVGTVEIINRGSDTLRIQNVETSCGCVVATPDAGRIAFMETATLRVSMNIENQTGMFYESVVLYTNDPTRPRVSLTCRANIVPSDSTPPNH